MISSTESSEWQPLSLPYKSTSSRVQARKALEIGEQVVALGAAADPVIRSASASLSARRARSQRPLGALCRSQRQDRMI